MHKLCGIDFISKQFADCLIALCLWRWIARVENLDMYFV